jgi:Asp-tRNA(Asn)/Glu-tRNA(Gln) amidotransferase A subunit family amidase
MDKLAGRFDALLLPPSTTQAPEPSSTGESTLQAPFSLSGQPSITLPTGLSEDGLPHGVQLVGRLGHDHALLSTAAWCESVLPAPALPSPPVGEVAR